MHSFPKYCLGITRCYSSPIVTSWQYTATAQTTAKNLSHPSENTLRWPGAELFIAVPVPAVVAAAKISSRSRIAAADAARRVAALLSRI